MPRYRSLALWSVVVTLMSASLSPEATTAADKEMAENDPLAAYEQSEAFTHNAAWHKQVRENEIRMGWFLHGSPGIAMVCTADLSASEVTTSREVYNHASQTTESRKLSHAQVLTLQKLIEKLPPEAQSPEFKNLLLVSIVEKGKAQTRLYDRLELNRNIVRLYDLTGAYVDTKDPDKAEAGARGDSGEAKTDLSEEEAVRVLIRKAKARIDGTVPPASWPQKINRVGTAWVVDIDTTRLPSGYPEQIVVEVTSTGGHSGKPKLGVFNLYDGFKADQIALRKTVQRKVTNATTDTVETSSAEACQAASRIFGHLSFLSKTRNDVLNLLGDPATIGDYNKRADDDPSKPLVYIFDSGFGGQKYTLMFRNGVCTGVESEDLE